MKCTRVSLSRTKMKRKKMNKLGEKISELSTTVKAIAAAVTSVVIITSAALTVDHTYVTKNDFVKYQQAQVLKDLKTTRALELANVIQLENIEQRTMFEKKELKKALYTINSIDTEIAKIVKGG